MGRVKETPAREEIIFLAGPILIFLLVTMLAFALSRHFSSPMTEIARVAKKIADGDFSEKISPTLSGNAQDLALAIKHMAEPAMMRMEKRRL